jgi:hypothetical protein
MSAISPNFSKISNSSFSVVELVRPPTNSFGSEFLGFEWNTFIVVNWSLLLGNLGCSWFHRLVEFLFISHGPMYGEWRILTGWLSWLPFFKIFQSFCGNF